MKLVQGRLTIGHDNLNVIYRLKGRKATFSGIKRKQRKKAIGG